MVLDVFGGTLAFATVEPVFPFDVIRSPVAKVDLDFSRSGIDVKHFQLSLHALHAQPVSLAGDEIGDQGFGSDLFGSVQSLNVSGYHFPDIARSQVATVDQFDMGSMDGKPAVVVGLVGFDAVREKGQEVEHAVSDVDERYGAMQGGAAG